MRFSIHEFKWNYACDFLEYIANLLIFVRNK